MSVGCPRSSCEKHYRFVPFAVWFEYNDGQDDLGTTRLLSIFWYIHGPTRHCPIPGNFEPTAGFLELTRSELPTPQANEERN